MEKVKVVLKSYFPNFLSINPFFSVSEKFFLSVLFKNESKSLF